MGEEGVKVIEWKHTESYIVGLGYNEAHNLGEIWFCISHDWRTTSSQ